MKIFCPRCEDKFEVKEKDYEPGSTIQIRCPNCYKQHTITIPSRENQPDDTNDSNESEEDNEAVTLPTTDTTTKAEEDNPIQSATYSASFVVSDNLDVIDSSTTLSSQIQAKDETVHAVPSPSKITKRTSAPSKKQSKVSAQDNASGNASSSQTSKSTSPKSKKGTEPKPNYQPSSQSIPQVLDTTASNKETTLGCASLSILLIGILVGGWFVYDRFFNDKEEYLLFANDVVLNINDYNNDATYLEDIPGKYREEMTEPYDSFHMTGLIDLFNTEETNNHLASTECEMKGYIDSEGVKNVRLILPKYNNVIPVTLTSITKTSCEGEQRYNDHPFSFKLEKGKDGPGYAFWGSLYSEKEHLTYRLLLSYLDFESLKPKVEKEIYEYPDSMYLIGDLNGVNMEMGLYFKDKIIALATTTTETVFGKINSFDVATGAIELFEYGMNTTIKGTLSGEALIGIATREGNPSDIKFTVLSKSIWLNNPQAQETIYNTDETSDEPVDYGHEDH